MKVLLFLLLVALCHAGSPSEEWVSFKTNHGKKYRNPAEEHYRMKVFFENQKMIEEHNKNFELGAVTYNLRMNHFGDLTVQEFKGLMNKYNSSKVQRRQLGARFTAPANVAVPDSIDWRQKGAVTPVKDQGQCGSCWAFSTTGSLEGQVFRKTGKLVSLSEQQLVDCGGEAGNQGCSGGLMDNAFTYIRSNGGIESEDAYPYEGIDASCRFRKSAVAATDVGFVDIPSGNEEALKVAVGTNGPVSVAIDASQNSFQFYSTGVYYESQCSPQALDHGVLLVGYGTENGQDYWLVKNSWNTAWGDAGYIKMARNKNNHCGIATQASYPTV